MMFFSNDVFLENGATYYFANDHLGSSQAIFDQNGQTVWQARYDPFGAATISPDSTLVNNLRLPGQYFDSETELHYNWHRYYEPGLGRYLSVTRDEIGDSLHRNRRLLFMPMHSTQKTCPIRECQFGKA